MLKGIQIISTLTALLTMFAGLQGCGPRTSDKGAEVTVSDSIYHSSLPESIKELTRAISANDAEKFAGLVSYPLGRPYPLHNILNQEDMKRYYNVMVDDSLRKVVADAGPSMWSDSGWRGWMLANGEYLWIDDKVYDIPYLSEAETAEHSRLVQLDTLSIEPGLRHGWVPVECLRSARQGKTYRIDHNPRHRSRDSYRLTVWDKTADLKGEPTRIFLGHRQSEGTAETVTYFFRGRDGSSAVYSPDMTDAGEAQRVIISEPDDRIKGDTVANVYWLELL